MLFLLVAPLCYGWQINGLKGAFDFLVLWSHIPALALRASVWLFCFSVNFFFVAVCLHCRSLIPALALRAFVVCSVTLRGIVAQSTRSLHFGRDDNLMFYWKTIGGFRVL